MNNLKDRAPFTKVDENVALRIVGGKILRIAYGIGTIIFSIV